MKHSHDHTALTKNQTLVYGALSRAAGPLSAYSILDDLRGQGLRAPLQVYRALDKLVEFGLVHRLESLNAFVACSQPNCEEHVETAFAICERCGVVTEFADAKVSRNLRDWAAAENFRLEKTTLELRGLCRACQAA